MVHACRPLHICNLFQDSFQLLSHNYATKAEVGAGEHGYTLSMMAN